MSMQNTISYMLKYLLVLNILFGFIGCNEMIPEAVLSQCNQQQEACNRKANHDICGQDCVHLIIAGPTPAGFTERIKQCDDAYIQCLYRK